MNRRKRPELSKGESVVVSALWRLQRGTLGEIHQEVLAHQKMEYTTVQSYLRRLEAKGYVKFKNYGRTRIYQAAIKPETVIGNSIDRFVEQMVSGDSMPILRHLVQRRGLTQDELKELGDMIEAAQAEESSGDD